MHSFNSTQRIPFNDFIADTSLTWDQAQFLFSFVNNIPAGKAKRKPSLAVAIRENVWEPLKFRLISGQY